jgi:hypothetical protein
MPLVSSDLSSLAKTRPLTVDMRGRLPSIDAFEVMFSYSAWEYMTITENLARRKRL